VTGRREPFRDECPADDYTRHNSLREGVEAAVTVQQLADLIALLPTPQ